MPKPAIIFPKYANDTALPSLQVYLTATASLTAKLEKLSGQKLIVKPITEGRQILTMHEKRQLGLSLGRVQSAWVREVWLQGVAEGEPWVQARSIFPFTSLIGDAKQLANLGSTPIGYVLFGRGGATLQTRWISYTSAQSTATQDKFWQRTSLYRWQGRPFLISETFLPAFEDFLWQKSRGNKICNGV